MFKFVVLCVLLAVVSADPAPGNIYSTGLGHAYAPLAYPLAKSYQNRVDVIKSVPVVHSTPVIGHSGYGWPAVGYNGLGQTYGHGYGLGGQGWLGGSGLIGGQRWIGGQGLIGGGRWGVGNQGLIGGQGWIGGQGLIGGGRWIGGNQGLVGGQGWIGQGQGWLGGRYGYGLY